MDATAVRERQRSRPALLRRLAASKALWLAVLASQLLLVVGFWAWNHVTNPIGNQLTGDAPGQLLAWGRLAGMLAAFGALFQIVLVGRTRWVESAFGLDRLSRLHHVAGFALLAAILAHPVLVTLGRAGFSGDSFGAQLLDIVRSEEDAAGAAVALGIMLAAVAFSVVVLVRRMRYEWWHATHLTLYAAVALAFGHQLALGNDLNRSGWFRAYWIGLFAFVAANLLWFRLLRPLRDWRRHRFRVERLVAEAGDVTSVHIAGRTLERFRARAGQFVIVRFLAPGFRWEAHPFSLSAEPDGRGLRLSIKALGDYTRRIPRLPAGTEAIIDGPHGAFTAERCRGDKALFIAGGIGITPIRALAAELAGRGADLVLLYGNRSREGIVFEKELAEIAASSGRLRVERVLSADQSWTGESGNIDRERIARLVPDLLERDVFLCGPPRMMKSVRSALWELGVSGGRVHYERFAL